MVLGSCVVLLFEVGFGVLLLVVVNNVDYFMSFALMFGLKLVLWLSFMVFCFR